MAIDSYQLDPSITGDISDNTSGVSTNAGGVSTNASDILSKPPRYNYIINGDLKMSQRGTYTSAQTATNNNYYLDRWRTSMSNCAATVQQISTSQPSALTGGKSIKYLSAAGGSNAACGSEQKIENWEIFKNQTVTLSAWVKSNSVQAQIGFLANGWSPFAAHTGDQTWQFLSVSLYVTDALSAMRCFFRLHQQGGGTTINAGDYIEWAGAKLEIGSVATPFTPRLPGEELALCERFYQKSYNLGIDPGAAGQINGLNVISANVTVNNGSYVGDIQFRTGMRTSPTIKIYGYQGGGPGVISNGSGIDQAAASGNSNFSGMNGAAIINQSGGNLTVSANSFLCHWTAESEL